MGDIVGGTLDFPSLVIVLFQMFDTPMECGAAYGSRTRLPSVKGWCPNR